MKKLLFTVLAAVTLTFASAQEAFPDIPAGHWAGEAVARIADLGIVIGFPDGTFRGNESFTRYQAALVISRLLDVIQQDMDAMAAMNEADLASLRNALQELASDVAAQGVRLNAVEGSVASLSDDVVSNTARIEALEAMDMSGGMDPAVLEDLQNQIAAARTAADTAAAQAAAAENLANSADAQARQNASDIDTINDLLARLNEEIVRLGGQDQMAPDMSGIEGRIDRNTNDIANIREFVILLRRDQVALRDRVAALEAADAEQSAQLEDLAARVTAIEDDLLVVSGSIGLTYEVGRLSGSEVPFDVDRIFGLNNERDMGPSTFGDNADDLNDDDDDTDDGEEAQDRDDISSVDGDIDPDLELTVGFGTERAGTGDDRALNSFEAVITLKLEKAVNLCPDDDFDEATNTCPVDDDGDSQIFEGYVFTVDDFEVNFDPIGAEPLTFLFGSDIGVELTPYILDFDDGEVIDTFADEDNDLDVGDVDGFVATVGSPDFLSFLAPTLTVVYGSEDGGDDDTYYRAIRGTLSPLQGETFSATGGVTFAQRAENAGENGDAAGDNVTTTVYGVDGQIGVSILDIDFAYNMSSTTGGDIDESNVTGDDTDSSLAYVQVTADVESFPIIDSLDINYRDIPGIWAGFADNDNYVFELDQAGFKVAAGLGIFIFDVAGYFDSYITGATGAELATSAYGVDVAAELFRAFSLTGFFHSVSIDGTVIDEVSDDVETGTERDDNEYDTGFGVGIVHDGAADNALIPNLNLEFAYEQLGEGFDETHILASADYELAISILTLTPYVSYESFNDEATGSDDETEIKAGTGLATEPLNIFLQPSLIGAVNYRTNSHTDVPGNYDASELQYSVGLVLNEFLLENSTLTAKYGSYTGTNMTLETNSEGSGDFATDISAGDENNGATQSTSGYEIIWDYWDLEFAYGAYSDSITDGGAADRDTAGQFFRIDYTVNF